MRRIARWFSILLVLVSITALLGSVSAVAKSGPAVLLRMVVVVAAFTPLFLAAVVLGPKTHRWERIALIANGILAICSAVGLAWAAMTPSESASLPAMVLIAAVLNWASMVENVQTKMYVVAGFAIWAFFFLILGSATTPDSGRTLAAVTGGLNVMAFYVLGGGAVLAALTFGYLKLNGVVLREKNDPMSKACREGNLAFRNDLGKDTNPYMEKDDKRLTEMWLAGYDAAAETAKNRNI